MSNENRRHLISMALAVLQPLALSWITVVVLSVFSYVLSASSPMLGQSQWQDAAQLGTSVWLLALGAPLAVGEASIGLMPLLLTAGIAFVCYRFLRRAGVLDWVDVGVCMLAAALTIGFISLFSLPGSFRLMAVLGGAAILGSCALFAWWRQDPPEVVWWERVGKGWPLLWPLLAALGLVSLVCLAVAVVLGWPRILEINGYYVLGTVGTVFLTSAQILFLPNFLTWSLAYISGSGFAIGSGTEFSSLGVESAPLPALPVLGALPSPGTTFPWLIALPIFMGLLVGLWRARRFATLGQLAVYGAGTTVTFLIVAALLGTMSSGGIGPGRMEMMGVEPPLFAAILTLETCGGMLLGLFLRNPQLHEKLRGAREKRKAAAKLHEAPQAENADSSTGESFAESDGEGTDEPGTDEADESDGTTTVRGAGSGGSAASDKSAMSWQSSAIAQSVTTVPSTDKGNPGPAWTSISKDGGKEIDPNR